MIDQIVENIARKAGMPKKEVKEMVDEKYKELSELVSEEGAAYIVAKELGVNSEKKGMKISEIKPSMRVELLSKVLGETTREFSTSNSSGKVQNVLLGDESGTIRLTLWNDEIEKYNLQKGDNIGLRGFSKEDNKGMPELRLGKYGVIEKIDEEIKTAAKNERKNISELTEGYGEIRASVVHVFESKPFYHTCPVCGISSKDGCSEHKDSEPADSLVINAIVDDGTGNVRAVFFKENAEKLLGFDTQKAKELYIRGVLFKKMSIGREMVLRGRCKKNKLFERNEFVVNDVNEVNVKEEIDRLL